jgi:hypothetical protein
MTPCSLYKFKDNLEENVMSVLKVEKWPEEGDSTFLGRPNKFIPEYTTSDSSVHQGITQPDN